MEKMNEEMKKEVELLIHDAMTKATSFSTRKIGDTPTDANQLTPKGYVDNVASSVLAVVDAEIDALQEAGGTIISLTGTHVLNSSILGTTETSIISGTLPAGLMGPVDSLQYRAFVTYILANGFTPTLTIRFKLGSQVFSTIGYAQGDATTRIYKGIITGVVQNTSVFTAQVGAGNGVLMQDATGSSIFSIGEYHANTTTVDTTSAQTVSMTAEFSGDNRGTLTVNTCEIQLLKRLIS